MSYVSLLLPEAKRKNSNGIGILYLYQKLKRISLTKEMSLMSKKNSFRHCKEKDNFLFLLSSTPMKYWYIWACKFSGDHFAELESPFSAPHAGKRAGIG